MQELLLQKLHEGHQGIVKSKLRAKECMYWISIHDDIEAMVKNCPICQKYKHSQAKMPLMPHDVPSLPWHTLGTDLFYYEGNQYLLIADYYSKYFMVRKMPAQCTSQAVVNDGAGHGLGLR